MTGRDDVTSAEENYLGAWRLLVEASNGGTVEETDDVLRTGLLAVASMVDNRCEARALLTDASVLY